MAEPQIPALVQRGILGQAPDMFNLILNQYLDVNTGSAAHGSSLSDQMPRPAFSPTPVFHIQW